MSRPVPCLLILLPLFALGCARQAGVQASWIARHGGLLEGEVRHRPRALLAQLVGDAPPRADVDVKVLSSAELAAYSWPDGSVFVTAALVNRLNDAELTAALAHELGHLLSDCDPQSPDALSGRDRRASAQDKEERADALGLELLRRRTEVLDTAMISMLEKVTAAEPPASPSRPALARRIDRLRRAARPSIHSTMR